MTKEELDLAKSINECVEALSKDGVEEPFTVYIDESKYSRELIKTVKSSFYCRVILKFVPRGTNVENVTVIQNAIGEQVE